MVNDAWGAMFSHCMSMWLDNRYRYQTLGQHKGFLVRTIKMDSNWLFHNAIWQKKHEEEMEDEVLKRVVFIYMKECTIQLKKERKEMELAMEHARSTREILEKDAAGMKKLIKEVAFDKWTLWLYLIRKEREEGLLSDGKDLPQHSKKFSPHQKKLSTKTKRRKKDRPNVWVPGGARNVIAPAGSAPALPGKKKKRSKRRQKDCNKKPKDVEIIAEDPAHKTAWITKVDPISQKTYYANKVSEATNWTIPEGHSLAPEATPAEAVPLPTDAEERVDKYPTPELEAPVQELPNYNPPVDPVPEANSESKAAPELKVSGAKIQSGGFYATPILAKDRIALEFAQRADQYYQESNNQAEGSQEDSVLSDTPCPASSYAIRTSYHLSIENHKLMWKPKHKQVQQAWQDDYLKKQQDKCDADQRTRRQAWMGHSKSSRSGSNSTQPHRPQGGRGRSSRSSSSQKSRRRCHSAVSRRDGFPNSNTQFRSWVRTSLPAKQDPFFLKSTDGLNEKLRFLREPFGEW